MPDRIELHGLRVVAKHGVLDAERERAQPFEIDIDLEVDLRAAGLSDDLADTVNYAEILNLAARIATGKQCYLLEHIAEQIAQEVLRHPRVRAVDIAIRKLQP